MFDPISPNLDTLIPTDLLSSTKTKSLEIGYNTFGALLEGVTNYSLSMKFDENAFRSTEKYTEEFKLHKVDCQNEVDLHFLSGFHQLKTLDFYFINNIHRCLPNLPSLPRLSELRFEFANDLDKLEKFPNLSVGLKILKITQSDIGDAAIGKILEALLPSSSNTLEELELDSVPLTFVPKQISSFKTLKTLQLKSSKIQTLKAGDLTFSVPVLKMDLGFSKISTIEPGAFQGK